MTQEVVAVRYDAPPTLGRFLGSDHPVRLAVGPFGSGKSSACIMEFIRRASEQAKGKDGIRRTRFAAVRQTYPELRDTTRKTFAQWIPAALGKWNEQRFTFHMKFGDVDSEILFRSLDGPEDVKKLLSLELTGAYINEWREISKEIFDGLTGRIGRYPSVPDGGASWRGIWGDTNPWHPTHWISTLLRKEPRAIEVFRQPGGREPDAENIDHLEPGYYGRLCIGKDEEWIRVYVDGKDALAAHGSIYGKIIADLRARGGVTDFAHGIDHVFTAWDFGIADSMSIWWFRFNAQRGVDIIDWYENSGEGLPHYFEICKAKPYKYVAHYLPHDARARSWHTGRSAVELFEECFGAGDVLIAPELSVDDGIGAARWLLEQKTTQVHSRCEVVPAHRDYSGVGMLGEYRFSWDETNKTFSKIPLHNFASHSADAFRVLACAVRHGEIISREPKPPVPPDLPRVFVDESGVTRMNRTFNDLSKGAIARRPRIERV